MSSRSAAAEKDTNTSLWGTMRRRLETRLAMGVLLGLVAVWALLGIAELLNPGTVAQMDAGALRFVRQGPELAHLIGPSPVEHAVFQLTSMGGSSVIIVWVAIIMGYFVVSRRLRHAVHLGVATVGGAALGWTGKYLAQRPRPQVVPHLMPETGWSFPSGHATITMVVFMTLAMMLANHCTTRIQKFYVVAAALGLMGLTGGTRLLLGVHYPTDVLAGWTLGLGWALVAWMVGYALENGAASRFGVAGKSGVEVDSTSA